jgi:hypothetical protein
MKLHISLITSILFVVHSVSAQTTSNRSALIIGVGEYGYSGATPLAGVKHDMVSAAKIATAMGIPENNVKYLRNSQATKANILDALKQLGDTASEGSRTFVYFSGHGTRQPAGNECVEGLLTYEGSTISNQEFAGATQKIAKTADKFITLVDACHSEGVVPPKTRALLQDQLTPKFYMKSGTAANACSVISNYKTRSLLPEVTKLGALKENFVQVSSSRPDEVSFDEPDKGGLATQGIRDCLLGQAKDTNQSGAVTLEEVQQCAQRFVDGRLKNVPGIKPHHITVTGNRNLIPVQRPPTVVAVAMPPVEPPKPVVVPPTPPVVVTAPAPAPAPAPATAPASVPAPQVINPATLPPEPEKIPPAEPILASLATLKDIEQQRNPRRVVDVKVSKTVMKIGKDSLDLSIKSSHDGFIYMILLGSDAKSFYVLYPNGLDKNNTIKAGQTVRIPKPDWEVKAAGPAGTNNLLVMVSDTPRKLNTLTMAEPTAAEPFTYTLNDIGGRSALINFLTSSDGKSESFGAKLVAIKEVK